MASIDYAIKEGNSKKVYYFILILIFIVLLVVKIFLAFYDTEKVDSNLYKSASNVEVKGLVVKHSLPLIDNILAGLLVVIAVSLFIDWVLPENTDDKLEFSDNRKYNEAILCNGRKNCSTYRFSGGLGRYTRTTTLAELHKTATEHTKTIHIYLQLLNPTDENACKDFASYRKSGEQNLSNKAKWNAKYVAKQIYITILTAFIYNSISNYLEITVGIDGSFSLFRIDLAEEVVVFISKEDPEEKCVIISPQNPLYNSFREEFFLRFKQSKELNFKNISSNIANFENVTPGDVIELFNNLDISYTFTDDEIKEIIKDVKNTNYSESIRA